MFAAQSHLMWFQSRIIRSKPSRIDALKLVPKWPMFAVQRPDDCSSLQIGIENGILLLFVFQSGAALAQHVLDLVRVCDHGCAARIPRLVHKVAGQADLLEHLAFVRHAALEQGESLPVDNRPSPYSVSAITLS
jgi:hypothetical protein